ncbi:MAG: hypothetical protein ACHQK9_15060 [Reyranellales bacterium]
MKVMLALAVAADLVLAALLIGLSGFILGGGPEGMHGATGVAIGWALAFVACLAAPVIGFLLVRRARPGLGAFIAWIPPIGTVIFFSLPIHPY